MIKELKAHLRLWKLLFKTAPGYMIYFCYDAFRYQFMIFIEHVLCIRYVLYCAEFGEPFWKPAVAVAVVFGLMIITIIPDSYFQHGMNFKTKPKLYKALKEKLYEKASSIDLKCYDDPDYYDRFVLAVAESETTIDRFLNLLNSIIQNLTVIFTTGYLYLSTDGLGLVFVMVSVVSTVIIGKELNKFNYEVRMKVNPLERKRNYVSRIFYLVDYAKELRLHPQMGDMHEEMFEEANDEIYEHQKKISNKRTLLQFTRNYLLGDLILDGFFLIYLVYKAAVAKTIAYSDAVILFNRAGSLKRSLRGIADNYQQLNENYLYLNKIESFLATEPEIEDSKGIAMPEKKGDLVLDHVCFSYKNEEGSDNEVLHDISLNVKAGEHIAIVGYNGAGKTTLIKLLMRLYDPTSGSISLCGQNIKEYDINSYRDRVGVVFQDFQMFGATLLENVVLNDVEEVAGKTQDGMDKLKERVLASLERSNFSDRLRELPAGLETGITTEFDEKGVNLSGGESQKVAISRAFYKDSDILIMDEPSSALDPIAEYSLNKAMEKAAEGKTVFYISHRLSTTRDADKIIMLEKGRIIEQGTHDQLLALDGKYAQMWKAQAGKYTVNL